MYIEYEDDDMSPLVGLELLIPSLYEQRGPTHQRIWNSRTVKTVSLLDLSLYPTYHSPALPMLYGDLSPVRSKEVFQHWRGHQPANVLRSLVYGILATARIYSTSSNAAMKAVHNAVRLLHTQAAVPRDELISLIQKWCTSHPQCTNISTITFLVNQLKYDGAWDW